MLIISVTLVVSAANIVSSFSVIGTNNEQDISNMTVFENGSKISENENAELVTKRDINEEDDNISDLNDNDKEIFEAAESSNLVYRPLFVYRKIQHSKRRITMFNSFAG